MAHVNFGEVNSFNFNVLRKLEIVKRVSAGEQYTQEFCCGVIVEGPIIANAVCNTRWQKYLWKAEKFQDFCITSLRLRCMQTCVVADGETRCSAY